MSKKVIVKRKLKTATKQVTAGLLALSIAISGMGVSVVKDSNTAKAVSACYTAFVPQFPQTVSVDHGLELDDAFDRTAFTKQYTAGTTISVSHSNSKRNAYSWNSSSLPGGSSTDNTYTILAVTDKNDRIVYAESMVHNYASVAYYIKDARILYGSMPSDITDNRLSSLGADDIASVDYSSYGYKAGFVGASVSYNMCTLSAASDKTSLDYNIYTYQSNVGSSLGSYNLSYAEGAYHLWDKFNAGNILTEAYESGNRAYFLEGSPTTTALENLCNNKTKDGEDLFSVSGYTFYGWTSTYQSEYTLHDKVITGSESLSPSANCTHYYPAFISETPKISITVNASTSKTQSVTLSATDDKRTSGGISGLKYYFGTDSNPDGSSYIASTGPGYFSITEEISSAGTYYFIVKDEDGNSSKASIICYDVTMNPNGGTVTYGGIKYTGNFTITRAKGKTITLPTASKSGYSFQSWGGKTGTYTVTGNTTLTAIYTDTKAPTPSIAKTESSGLTQNITLSATDNEGITGYYFGTSSSPSYSPVSSTKNWSHPTSINAAGTYYLFTKDATGNVNSTSITCYAVTMNPNGGSTTFGGASYNSSFTAVRASGESITLPSATKSGYRFTGWSGKTGTYTVDSTTTLTAGYVDSEQSTASITVNGTSDRTQSLTLSGTDNEGITAYYFGTNSSPSAGSYTSVSSTKNWSKTTTVSAAGTYYLYTKDAAGNVSTAKSVTCYKVDLNPNGGTSSYNGTSYSQTFSFIKAGGTLINLPSAERNGYTFGGWSGYTSVYTVNANATLSVAWTPVKYNISYDLDGGKLTKINPSVYTIETDSFTLNNPERDGYSFDGWTGSNGESASKEVTIAKGTTGNLSFTAKWTHLYDYNTDTKSLVLFSGSNETIADVISKHPEVENITIEAGVDAGNIDFSVFPSLKSISVSAENTDYVSENGILYDADRKMLYCPIAHEDNPSISKKCTEIAENAFKDSTVTTLNIPYSVKKIRSGAFENCTKLAEITIKNPNCIIEEETIPSTIKTVSGFEDSLAIQHCVENDIPYKVITTLSSEFFADEVTMTSFSVPDNITDIEKSAFAGCKNLTEISLGAVSSIGAYAFAHTAIANKENNGIVSLPETVESVAEGAFNKCDAIKKLRVNSMTTEFAWSDTTLTLPKTVVIECYYGSKAYEYAKSHDYPISLLVGYEADNTEKYVSGDTENLVSVSFGPLIKEIGENAFCGAENLVKVSFDEKSVLETIGTKAFSETGLTEISLPESVTTLGTGVFKDSAALETASLGGVTVVPAETFSGCSALENVTETENWTSLGDNAFCGTGVIEFKAGKAMTKFGRNVFADSALTKLSVENSNCIFPNEGGLVPEGAVIKGYQNSSADVYSQTYYDSACEEFGKPAYIIFFDMTGGKNGTEKVYAVNGDKIPSIEVPEREDYDFAGYYVHENGRGTKYFDADGNSVKDWDSTTNITLYAAWNHQTYTVVYDGNGATGGTMENSVFRTNTEIALAKNIYEKTGSCFLGWSKNSSAKTPDYTNKEIVKNLAKSGGMITLYAVWTKGIIPEHTIRYDANGGEMNLVTNTFFEGYGTSITSEKPVRKGFVFAGWTTVKGSSHVKYNADDVIDSCEDVVLYAVWNTEGDTEYKIITYVQETDGSYREDIQVCRAEYGMELTLVENVDFVVEDGWYVNMIKSRLGNTIDTGTVFKIYLDRHIIYEGGKEKPDATPVPTATAQVKRETGLVSKVAKILYAKKSGEKKPTAITIGNVIYKLPGNSATVSRAFSKKINKVIIPKTVHVNGKSYKVTSITKNAFKGCKKLKKVSIKANIRKVEKSAFAGIHKKAVFKIPKKCYGKVKKLLSKKSVGYKKTMKILKK